MQYGQLREIAAVRHCDIRSHPQCGSKSIQAGITQDPEPLKDQGVRKLVLASFADAAMAQTTPVSKSTA
jgi:hypothetical protein